MTGRKCLCCSSAHLVAIDSAIREGSTYVAISQHFNISQAAVRRHAVAHLPGASIDIASTRGAAAISTRLREAADRSRLAAIDAASLGQHALMLRANDSEVRALRTLAESLGITHEESLRQIDEAVLLVRAARRLSPAAGRELVEAFDALGARDMAEIWASIFAARAEIENSTEPKEITP